MASKDRPRIIFLTGAPLKDELDWNEDQLTAGDAFSTRACSSFRSDSTSSSGLPRWRVVSTIKSHLQELKEDDETIFLCTGDLAANDDDPEDFLNHSFSQLEAAQLPDITDATILNIDSSGSATFESFYSAATEHAEPAKDDQDSTMPQQLAVINLKNIPSAAHLERIAPQTMTVNILVGIVAVQPPRTVQLRRSKAQMDLMEIVVGDETRAGFSITVWLSPHAKTSNSTSMRTTIAALRPGDVVLFTTLALSAFKGCVYGQTLNRRNLSTRLWQLEGRTVHAELRSKVSSVTAWRDHFVGRRQLQRSHNGKEILPPETP